MKFKLSFELSRWMCESTSNLSPTRSDVEGGDLEVGPIDDQVLPNTQEGESNLLDLVEENEFPEVNDDHQTNVALPRKRKVYFYIFYCIFVILYVVLVLVTTCTYPLKPEYNINISLPVDKDTNYTEEMKQSVSLYITLDNRNKLTSALYDDINITMLYLPSPNTNIYFASTIIPGFYQHKLKPKKLVFHMPAPGLPGLLKEDLIKMDFRVILEFKVKFHCKFLCKPKHHFLIVEEIEYLL